MWLLGVASIIVVATGGVVAIVGHDDPHRLVAASAFGPAPAPQPVCDTAKGRALRRLGATPRDWARMHTQTYDPDGTLATRWDPDRRLPRFRGHEGAVYNATTTFEDCAIDSYYVQLAHPTTVSAAVRRARLELPADAEVLWHRRLPQCVQLQFTSTTLSTQLRNRGRDFTVTTGAIVSLIEAHHGDVNSVTRIGFVLKPTTIPQLGGGCLT
jgi:hypothetical protein